MEETQADLRERLASGRPLIGTVVTVPDVVLAELTASAFDFVWIDLEHGAIGAADVAPLAIAARAAGAASLVRVRSAEDPALGPALDAGADGIVVPRVDRASDAASAVRRLRRVPRGVRGHASRRATRFFAAAGPEEPVCMAQIESAAGLGDVEAIAAVDGVDAVVVGCADLEAALRADASGAGDLGAAVERVQRAATAAGVASGVAGPDDPELLARLAEGSTVRVIGADLRIYASALAAAAGGLRQAAALRAPETEEAHVST